MLWSDMGTRTCVMITAIYLGSCKFCSGSAFAIQTLNYRLTVKWNKVTRGEDIFQTKGNSNH